MANVQLDVPDALLDVLGREEVRSIATEQIVVTLYQRGYISSGKVTEFLHISRREALDLLCVTL